MTLPRTFSLTQHNPIEETKKLKALLDSDSDFNVAMAHIKAGANPDTQNTDGNTLLHLLAVFVTDPKKTCKEIIDAKNAITSLVNDYNANKEIKNNHEIPLTPLQCVLLDNFSAEDIKFFLNLGFDKNTKDIDGNSLTAHLAKYNHNEKYTAVIQHLKTENADFTIADANQIDLNELKTNNYETLINKGTYAYLYRGMFANQDVVIKAITSKQLRMDFGNQQRFFFNEVSIMSKLAGSPNICPILGCIPKDYQIILKYAAYGSLLDYIMKPSNDAFTFSESYEIATGILNGISFIHENGFLHRDLKSANILLENNNNHWQPLVTDFGLAMPITDTIIVKNCGTPLYLAPELFLNPKTTIQSDLFSFSVIYAELAWFKQIDEIRPELTSNTLSDTLIEISSWMTNNHDPLPNNTPPKIAAMITWCRQPDPKKRPASAKEVLAETATNMNTLSENLESKLKLRF